MPLRHSKPARKFGRVTWDGRLIVDVNQLYRAKKTQDSLAVLDAKISAEAENGTHVPRRNE